MNKINKVQKDTVNAIGFWSSIAATICSVIFLVALILTFLVFQLNLKWEGIEKYASLYNEGQILTLAIPCFLLAPCIVMFTACLYQKAPDNRKILGLIALVFGIVYVSQISYNYYMQMTAVRNSIKNGILEGITPFAFGNLNSTFWSLETLGYTFLSMSMIFSGLLFRGSRIRLAVRWIFLVNGIWGVWAPFEQVLGITSPPIGLLVFAVSFPVSTILIAYLFHKEKVFVI